MNIRRIAAIVVAIGSALVVAACGSSGSSSSSSSSSGASASSTSSTSGGTATGTVNGAGSTFAAPIYQQWSSNLKSQGLTVNYNPVGSGTGVVDLQTATVDFAGNDQELLPKDISGMKGPVFQFPVAFGAITVSYNLPGVKSGLKLTGPVVADIFAGKITKWNDPAIASLNSGVSLPSTAITVVHRSDSSGTTAGFTTYLADVSPSWKTSIGAGKLVKWPVGTGGPGTPRRGGGQADDGRGWLRGAGVRAREQLHVRCDQELDDRPIHPADDRQHLGGRGRGQGLADPRNGDRQLAVGLSDHVADVHRSYQDPCKYGGASSGTAAALKSFLTYAFGDGQTLGSGSGQIPYAPLTASLVTANTTQLAKLVCNGSPIS